MASMLVYRSRPASKLVEKVLFSSARPIWASSARSFTNAAEGRDLDDEVDHSDRRAMSCRSSNDPFPSFFSDSYDPFYAPRTMSQVLNMVDRRMDSRMAVGRGMGGGLRRTWDAKDSADGLHLRIDMPGLGKEDVKVTVEQNSLVIKGEESEKDAGDGCGKYSTRIDLPAKVYRSDQIRAEMKNGVLKVFVPKVKEESNVLQINVE